MKSTTFLSLSLVASACAWAPSATITTTRRSATFLEAVPRRHVLQEALAAAAGAAVVLGSPGAALAAADEQTLPNGVTYSVTKRGDGPKPDAGELVAIRFSAYAGELKIDDIFDTPEPYYTRIGSGALIKGVEDTLPLMRLGDRWVLSIPGQLAFGEKGRPSSPGRPRIPPNAVIKFDVEMVGLPGKEPELIELIGDV